MKTIIRSALVSGMALIVSFPALAGGSSSDGVPNPAAKYCDDVGGIYGENSECTIDRAVISSWTLLEVHTKNKLNDATRAYLKFEEPIPPVVDPNSDGYPNPAAVYCGQLKGDFAGEGMCKFKDGSEIEEWTLFSGPQAEGNRHLTDIILNNL